MEKTSQSALLTLLLSQPKIVLTLAFLNCKFFVTNYCLTSKNTHIVVTIYRWEVRAISTETNTKIHLSIFCVWDYCHTVILQNDSVEKMMILKVGNETIQKYLINQ